MSQQTRDPNSTSGPDSGPAPEPHAGRNASLNGAPPASVPETSPDELQSMWGAVAALLDDVTVSPAQRHAPRPATSAPAAEPPAAEPPAAASPAAIPPALSATPEPPAEAAPASPEQGGPAAAAQPEPPAAAAPAPEPLPLPPWEQPVAPVAPAPPADVTPEAGAAAPPADVPAPAAAAPAAPAAGPVAGAPPPAAGATAAAAATAAAGAALPPEDMDSSAVSIRGRSDGLTVEIGQGKWDEIVVMLAQRLDHSGGFFRGAHVAVELGDRALNEQDLKELSDLLIRHEIVPGVVRTTSDRTFHSAIALGLAVIHESPEGSTLAAAQVAAGNAEQHSYYVYRGSLRSGQVLDRSDHVVIVGDVNPGAQVISDGDILVWGRLRGMAHAGANGKADSVIAALDLDPIQLRIDTVIAATPGGAAENRPRWYAGRSSSRRPEIARLVDHQLVIEAWDEAKVHGANILKRRRD